jgi:hypothetical protein
LEEAVVNLYSALILCGVVFYVQIAFIVLNAEAVKPEIGIISQEIAIKPLQEYLLGAYVKQLTGKGIYKITIQWLGADHNHISFDNDWKGDNQPASYQKQAALVYSPVGAAYARIFLGNIAGTSFGFDDVSLYEVRR